MTYSGFFFSSVVSMHTQPSFISQTLHFQKKNSETELNSSRQYSKIAIKEGPRETKATFVLLKPKDTRLYLGDKKRVLVLNLELTLMKFLSC